MTSARRDFTGDTKERLLRIADEVAPKNWWGAFTDTFSDGYSLTELNREETEAIQNGTEAPKSYERDIIDMNNMSQQQIRQIWSNVNADASTALASFTAADNDLEGFRQQLDALTATMNGGSQTGRLDLTYINGTLKNQITFYDKLSKLYAQIEDKGLTPDTGDRQTLTVLLKSLGAKVLQFDPSLELDHDWSLPIGPGLELTFSIGAKNKDGVGIALNVPGSVAKAQRQELQDMLSFNLGGGSLQLDANGNPVNDPNDKDCTTWSNNSNCGIGKDGEAKYSWSRTHGDKGQTYTLGISGQSTSVSVGISQNYGDASISSDLGLKASTNSHWRDFRTPEPVKVQVYVPDLNPDWNIGTVPETSPLVKGAETLVIIGGILLIVVGLLSLA
ncbi:hypothetical protein OZX62_00275 [Bifidobacterium sp. ESL0690]|uniref:hypothetical protein n=1 Tax=Bifidobacterium sp. ESL0690 TaxID=2983214 RepID=UPI0023F62691|nr:hypothetical protein [Bifidobacterium sp. ESL0690]WEV46784.1 hypothetical protein OZX62_00275 [Bifidobacterium sp. ESL0690]